MPEHPGVALVSNGPRDKHGEKGRGASAGDMAVSLLVPPFVDRVRKVPVRGVHVSKAKLGND